MEKKATKKVAKKAVSGSTAKKGPAKKSVRDKDVKNKAVGKPATPSMKEERAKAGLNKTKTTASAITLGRGQCSSFQDRS